MKYLQFYCKINELSSDFYHILQLFSLLWIMFITSKTVVLLKDALSRNFLHLYFLAPPCAVNARIFLSCDFSLPQKSSLSTLRPVHLLIPCPVLSHSSLNEEKFQVPNWIHSFAAVICPHWRLLLWPFYYLKEWSHVISVCRSSDCLSGAPEAGVVSGTPSMGPNP